DAVSDVNGKFNFENIKAQEITLHISHVSYVKDTIKVILPSKDIEIRLQGQTYISEELTVTATRVEDGSGFAHTNMLKEEIESSNFGQDLPTLMQFQPSVTVSSDAGAGIGYSGLRIRGSDATRVNVTINGIPVNDAESHQVYWVDLPDLASSTDNIQIQRGVGTSSNGTGSFGGSVNIQTTAVNKDPFASINSSAGSFNTFKNTLGFGSGLLKDHFYFEGKLSMIQSDGYIDRASSDLKSFFITGGYIGKSSSLKAVIMSGKEKTYQAWYGVPEDSLKTNRKFNPAGMYYDSNGQIQFYENQTDNYQQDNYQLHYTQALGTNLNFNISVHGTLGKGFYEEYAADDAFSNYTLPDLIINSDTIQNSDFIRERWLSNKFYGAIGSVHYHHGLTKITIGGAANKYEGEHYGELTWCKDQQIPMPSFLYYSDDSEKNELSLYVKISTILLNKLNLFADLQSRTVDYNFEGRDVGKSFLPQSVSYSFFNPKAGLSYELIPNHQIYASVGVGQKEPVRDDFVDSSTESRPSHERLTDYEAGYKFSSGKLRLALNYYYMDYQDQLILNGKINDVGEYTRQNVKDSYRTGMEFEFAYLISSKLNFRGNITMSKNKIKVFEEYIDDYDSGIQNVNTFSLPDIAFSPSLISSAILTWNPNSSFNVALTGKYTGKQYLDNTQNNLRKIDPYLINDLRIRYSLPFKFNKEFALNLQINNILDRTYSSSGYTYSYIYGGENSTFNYYFPQAGRNYMLGINLLF
ncbi:MAG: TonB-dependent receptor, partial [Bacteroidia bacterium]|nr:TonB-dependent receptor [Bacteroidia bacterium]